MKCFALVILALCVSTGLAYKNPYYWADHSVNVHLFEWKWDDIADECERWLGPKGFGGIQVEFFKVIFSWALTVNILNDEINETE